MKTQHNSATSVLKYFSLLLVLLLIVPVANSFAQNPYVSHKSLEIKKSDKGYNYLSYDMILGVRSFTVLSPIAEINQMQVAKAGGSFGVMYGNELIKAHARVGLFYAGMIEQRTVDMLDTDLGIQISMLSMFKERPRNLDVFISTGYNTQLHTFRGSYVSTEPHLVSSNPNLEPLVGRILSHNINYGAGISYTLRSDRQFFTFLAEYKTVGVLNAVNSGYLQTTRVSDVAMFNFGFRAGALKGKRK
jgi:hypothetical protein